MFGSGTKIYAVYIKPDAPAPHETAEFVAEHFSWMGFIFHGFWCAYHGLWFYALGLLIVWGALVAGGAQFGISLVASTVIELAVRLIVGFDGNHWRGQKLRRKGYVLSDVVSGESDLAAKRRFFENWLAVKAHA